MTKRVVIVGAGASARLVVKNLRANKALGSPDKVHITVTQPNKFATLPYYQTLILTKRDTVKANSTFVEIAGVDETVYGVAVGTSDGVLAVAPLNSDGAKDESVAPIQVPFDVLVAATGTSFPVISSQPGQSLAEREAEVAKVSAALTSGNHVVLAGGGVTGVELAGDILEALPAASRKGKVTIVCSTERLMFDRPAYIGERAKKVLEDLGAKVIFNDRVTSHKDTTVADSDKDSLTLTLRSGKELKCHVYIATYNRGANTSWLAAAAGNGKALPSNVLTGSHKVDVNEYLQSVAYDKLYATCAVNSRPEPSLFMNVEAHAGVVAANILQSQSKSVADGTMGPVYMLVGHETFGAIIPEALPMPAFCATLCCHWCGFPFNLLCPCFCCAVICGPVDPMTCGYCCSAPEGRGLTNTMMGSKKMGLMAQNAGYHDLGKPPASTMER
jgi:NADH dehydrogenase FAD-containing subunit